MNGGKPIPKLLPPSGRRPLTPDEENLWSLVARTVRPLRLGKRPATDARHKAGVRHVARPVADKAMSPPAPPSPSLPRKRGREELRAEEAREGGSPKRVAGVPALSPFLRKEKHRLARGSAAIDARIDLHGMTQAEAYGALRRLLHRSQASGAKFVLVITGRGAPNASRSDRGVLRRNVPMWLALPEFRRYVLGFDVADTGHGGEGALYVRLRRAKA
jgi:DNA-nicking Smr family endonuclease